MKTLYEIDKDLDILLIMPPSYGVNMPPLGIEYLNAYLKQNGIKSDTFDMNIDLYHKVNDQYKRLWNFENHRYWVDLDDFLQLKQLFIHQIKFYADWLISLDCPVLGFSINAGNRRFTLELLKKIKNKIPLIIIGGPFCKFNNEGKLLIPEYVDWVDVIVVGEGEETICEIMEGIKKGRSLNNIPGTLICKDGKISNYTPRPLIEKLDSLPFPKYRKELVQNAYIERLIPLLMSRGCLGKCSFCDARFYQPSYRFRKAENVVEEIKHHLRTTGISNFTFNDLAINWNAKELRKMCELIIEENLKIYWNASAYISQNLNYDLLSLMEKAGCSSKGEDRIFGVKGGSLVLGIESGSDKVLKAMNKYYTSQIAEETLKKAYKAGITTLVNIIVGFPGEGEREFQETIDFIRKNHIYIGKIATLSLCYAPEFSELKQNPEKFGIFFPEEDPMYHWFDKKGNNFKIRKERTFRLINILNSLSLPPLATTLNYTKDGKQISKDFLDEIKSAKRIPNITLVMSPPWEITSPPLGLGYLESYLMDKGIKVNIVDANVISYYTVSQDARRLWNYEYIDKWNDQEFFNSIKQNQLCTSIEKSVKEILRCSSTLIGFSVNQVNRLFVAELIKRIKELAPEKTIILGGPGVFHYEERLALLPIKDLVSACVKGEGEETLYELVDKFYKGETLDRIPGTVSLDQPDGTYIRKPIKNLDSLPFPKYKNFDLSLYSHKETIKILGSRGCVGKCKFCNDRIFLAPYRFRSAENIFEEIKFHYYKNSIRHFTFNDLIINGDPIQIEKLFDLIINSALKITWDANILPSLKFISEEMIEKAKQSGCSMLMLGIESGSNNVLEMMGKKKFFTIEEASSILKLLKKHKIEVRINIIVGYPGETEEDFIQTIEFIVNHEKYIDMVCSFNTCNIPLGSVLRNNKQQYGISCPSIPSSEVDWQDKDGNTRELRLERLKRVKDILSKHHIPYMQSNEGCFRDSMEIETFKKEDIFLQLQSPVEGSLIAYKKDQDFINQFRLKKKISKLIFGFPILTFITFISFIFSLYLWILKKVRGIIIFPGT